MDSVLGNPPGLEPLAAQQVLANWTDPAPGGPRSPHYEILPLNGAGALALPSTGNFFSLVVALLCPVSRGSVTLNPTDPFAAPVNVARIRYVVAERVADLVKAAWA
ncbi:hypothetical protein DFH07DRAFT_852991 [Mycena maculata]|uniref:Uncharacterized protein n=1 Tax=Mycena maculata TaxID=230809 RepID=A0AAD7HR09_9AGAR|nr:hypothetical protein DFH07DRAFT_852991 [Mycena maculata]